MSRPLRIEYPGALYHVTTRGNNGQIVFKDDSSRELFISVLKSIKNRYGLIIHSYCLMDNHYHLLVETCRPNLSEAMRQINGIYTQGFNKKLNRTGHLFQGRYKAIICDKDEYFLALVRYIVRNPVGAGLVDDPSVYRWSSYHETTAGRTKDKHLTEPDRILSYFSHDRDKAVKLFRSFVSDKKDETIWEDLKAGFILGSDDFTLEVKDLIEKENRSQEIIRKERYPVRLPLDEIFSDVSSLGDRNRQMAIAHEKYGYEISRIAEHLNLHYSTVSNILKNQREKDEQ